jgi:hypothetical protein
LWIFGLGVFLVVASWLIRRWGRFDAADPAAAEERYGVIVEKIATFPRPMRYLRVDLFWQK